jgi:hypothetical protein
MKHQYIISHEIYKAGQVVARGNQCLHVEGDEPPDASEFFRLIVADAKQRSGLDHAEVHITGVFKL